MEQRERKREKQKRKYHFPTWAGLGWVGPQLSCTIHFGSPGDWKFCNQLGLVFMGQSPFLSPSKAGGMHEQKVQHRLNENCATLTEPLIFLCFTRGHFHDVILTHMVTDSDLLPTCSVVTPHL